MVTPTQLTRTAAWIQSQQDETGAIPWHIGAHLDPWDHIQAAMGLSAAGLVADAERAYGWSMRQQRSDGTWAARYDGGAVTEPHVDANFTAYIATGIWHHWQVTADRNFLRRAWPMVDGALEAVLACQLGDGAFEWSPGLGDALVAGNSSIHLSLRCGSALATAVGTCRPAWQEAAESVRYVLQNDPARFLPKPHSMDWYYPLLGAALDPDAAKQRLEARWSEFVVDGLGVRCVVPNPWVTGAESCELVLALDAYGLRDQARAVLSDIGHLRRDDGSYWTGWVFDQQRDRTASGGGLSTSGARDRYWPVECTTWTAATVILAADALERRSAASGLFRGEGLP